MSQALSTFFQHGPHDLSGRSLSSTLTRQRVDVTVTFQDLLHGDKPFITLPTSLAKELISYQATRIPLLELAPGPAINPEVSCEGRGIYLGDCYLKGCGSPRVAAEVACDENRAAPAWDLAKLPTPFFDYSSSESIPRLEGSLRHGAAVLEFLHLALALEAFVNRTGIKTFEELRSSGHPIPVAVGKYTDGTNILHEHVRAYLKAETLSVPAAVFSDYGCILTALPGAAGRASTIPAMAISARDTDALSAFQPKMYSAGTYLRSMLERGWWLSAGSFHFQNVLFTNGWLQALMLDSVDHVPLGYKAHLLCKQDATYKYSRLIWHLISHGLEEFLFKDLAQHDDDKRCNRGIGHYRPILAAFFNGLLQRPKEDLQGLSLAAAAIDGLDGDGRLGVVFPESRTSVLTPIAFHLMKQIPSLGSYNQLEIDKLHSFAKKYNAVNPDHVYSSDAKTVKSKVLLREVLLKGMNPRYKKITEAILKGEIKTPAEVSARFEDECVSSVSVREGRVKEFVGLFASEVEYFVRLGGAFHEQSLAAFEHLAGKYGLSDEEARSLSQMTAENTQRKKFPALSALLDIYQRRIERVVDLPIEPFVWPVRGENPTVIFPGYEKSVTLRELGQSITGVTDIGAAIAKAYHSAIETKPYDVLVSLVREISKFGPTGTMSPEQAFSVTTYLQGPIYHNSTGGLEISGGWSYLHHINTPQLGWHWALYSARFRDKDGLVTPAIAWRLNHTKAVADSIIGGLKRVPRSKE